MQRMELIAPQFTASFHLCAVALSVHSLVGWFCYSFIHSLLAPYSHFPEKDIVHSFFSPKRQPI